MSTQDTLRATVGCHCGAVRFEVRGPLRDLIVCHCGTCRRIHGNFSAHSATKREDIVMLREDGLTWYSSSDKARRAHCRECGSGLFFDIHGRDVVSICAGALDQPTGVKTALHVFLDDAADYEACDTDAPRRSGWPQQDDQMNFG